uniref:Si:ch211-119d14.3 n=1 Tax=Nothobranchius rachovii TaxID=451742 RepID=A0A1A8QKL1_9TELE
MEARFGKEVASVVEVAIRSTVSVFRDAEEVPNEEAKFAHIQEIEKSLVAQIQKVFSAVWSELSEENEALRAKVEQLEDVLRRKAGQLEQELEARVGQLGRDMELLEKELKTISEGSSKTQEGFTDLEHEDSPTTSASTATPTMFVSTVPSDSTVLLVGANEVVTQTLISSLDDLKSAASPESGPQDVPSPDSCSAAAGLDRSQEKDSPQIIIVKEEGLDVAANQTAVASGNDPAPNDDDDDDPDYQTSTTTFKEGTSPKLIQQSVDVYQCPLCHKVGPYHALIPHLQGHQKSAVKYGKFNIYKCHLHCVPNSHYHCSFCQKVIVKKEQFLNHFKSCLTAGTTAVTAAPPLVPALKRPRTASAVPAGPPPTESARPSLATAVTKKRVPAVPVTAPKILLSKCIKTTCCFCHLVLLKKNLNAHIQRRHSSITQDNQMSQSSDVFYGCASAGGIHVLSAVHER